MMESGESGRTIDNALQQRIIDAADEYHYIAEDQWQQAVELEPENNEVVFEFRRLIRAALRYYMRAYLMLDMIETDDEQQFEDLYDIVCEQQPEVAQFFAQNDALAILDEEGSANISHMFSVAEAVRTALLDRSNKLAATLPTRFISE